MPFFKVGSSLVYYAHVPKCGGTSLSKYLEDRFGPIGLYNDTLHSEGLRGKAWCRTSPQHISADQLESIIPISLFDTIFSVVRHPVSRIISVYYFQKEVERRIPENVNFSEWLSSLKDDLQPNTYDNHVLPMSQIVPSGANIFHIENGLDPLVGWFDQVSGSKNGPNRIERRNVRKSNRDENSKKITPTSNDLELIFEIYGEDFSRFGYSLDQKMPISSTPPAWLGSGTPIPRRSMRNSISWAGQKFLRRFKVF